MNAVAILAAALARQGCDLRLGWYRGHPIAFRARGRSGSELHVVRPLAENPACHRDLLEHAVSAGTRHPRSLKQLLQRQAARIFAAPPPVDLSGLDAAQRDFYLTLVRCMADRNVLVSLNRNRSHIVSIRQYPFGYRTLSVHRQLLEFPEALPGLQALMAGKKHLDPRLAAAMQRVVCTPAVEIPGLENLPAIGTDFDFAACYREVHRRWFSDLSRPILCWARNPGAFRQLHSIRFGAYHRSGPPEIRLHPRLSRPWVAVVFVEAVFHHELCHHRQAENPQWRERQHSARFRRWEAQFPHYELVKQYEQQLLGRFLAPIERQVATEAAGTPTAPDRETVVPDHRAGEIQTCSEPQQLDLFSEWGL